MGDHDPLRLDGTRVYAELVATGTEWAEADAAASLLEETKKVTLAELKTRSGEKSDAARETEALASAPYRGHVEAMVAARRAANLARVKYDATKTLAEMRRTEAATRRVEMQLT